MDVGPQVCPGLLAALGVSKGMPQAQSDVSMPGPPRARQGDGQMGSWLIWLSWGPLSAVHGGFVLGRRFLRMHIKVIHAVQVSPDVTKTKTISHNSRN